MFPQASSTFADSKQHYRILDGLRGIAAVLVVCFHLFEVFALGDHNKQIINHGYLAVDFFFLLSGFVIGYAYNDRWKTMSLKDFFKRRLIRLHPMIIAGSVVGAIMYYFQASSLFPMIATMPGWKVVVVMLVGCTLLPLPISWDIRGWQEMHPLNGPAWSLYFEYIANILYALIVRRFSKLLLGILVAISGAALIHMAVTVPNGDLVGGWSLTAEQFRVGITRLMYPFFAGLLLQRVVKLGTIRHAFTLSALLLVIVMAIPRIAIHGPVWVNGLYDSLTVVLIFPLIVYIGASGKLSNGVGSKIATFLGNLSYPLYITHYPFIYWFTAWALDHPDASMSTLVMLAFAVLVGAIVLAYALLKLYDEPVRRFIVTHYPSHPSKTRSQP